jgi:hypothetical protein
MILVRGSTAEVPLCGCDTEKEQGLEVRHLDLLLPQWLSLEILIFVVQVCTFIK